MSRRTAAAATPPLFARSRPLRWLLRLPARIGHDPADPSDVRLHKAFLVAVSLGVLPPAVLWGILYWLFDERVAALFPWGYVALSLASLLAFHTTRSYGFLRAAELSLILVTPFLLSLVLGGLVPSSGVILAQATGHPLEGLLVTQCY